MRFNVRISPVRTQMTNTQKMNNYEMSTQNIPNSQVYYLEKKESKGINTNKILSRVCSTDESESKRVIINACSSDKST